MLGAVTVRFADAKAGVDQTDELVVATPVTDGAVPVSWEVAEPLDVPVADLEAAPGEPAEWAPLPSAATKAKSYETWSRDLAAWVYGQRRLELLRDPPSGALSRPGESERDFRVRLREMARAERDERLEALRKKYAPKQATLGERLRRAQQAEAREREQVSQQGVQAAISLGATILGAVLGRKTVSAGNIGRATTTARGAGRVLKEREDVARAQETVAAVQQALADLDTELQSELAALEARTETRAARDRDAPAEEERRPGAAVRARLDAPLARRRGHVDARLDVSLAPVDRRTPRGRPREAAPTPPGKKRQRMRSRFAVALAALLISVGLIVTLSMAAGPKQYQWTGTVTEIDAKEKTMSVDKSGEVWQFSTEGLKDAKVKKGDKVTVYYVAIAKKIEMK